MTWNGTTSGDFATGSNWVGGVAPTGSDLAQFNSPTIGGATTITCDITFTSNTGKIAFGGTSGYTLGATVGGNTIRFADGGLLLVRGTISTGIGIAAAAWAIRGRIRPGKTCR